MVSARKTTTMLDYSNIILYLLHSYENIKNIAKVENEITVFTQPPKKPLSEYVRERIADAIQGGENIEKRDLNQILINGFNKFMPQSMRGISS